MTRGRRGVGCLLVGVALICAGCGSGGTSSRGSTGKTASVDTSAPTAATGVAALGSVPDSASARAFISVSDLATIWRAAGFPAHPSVQQLGSKTGVVASEQASVAPAPVGSQLWSVVPQSPDPLGYPVLGVSVEMSAGNLPSDVNEVWVPVTAAQVASAVKPDAPARSTIDAASLFDFGSAVNPTKPAPEQDIIGVRYLAVPGEGNRVVAGGTAVSSAVVMSVTEAAQAPSPVSADPSVKPLLSLFGTSFQSVVMGTSLIGQPEGGHLPPAALARLRSRIGLSKLTAAPLMVGLEYTSGAPTHQTVIAAALYPSAADAKAAVASVGQYTATGTSLADDEPYSKLWTVTSDSAQGKLVVMHLSTQNGDPSKALLDDDFPLFWS